MPNSVLTAVRLMYAGAALSFIELVVFLSTLGGLKRVIQDAGVRAHKHYTPAQLHSLEVSFVIQSVIIGLVAIALWIWMARANAAGHRYARITGTVLFGLNTLSLLLSLVQPHAGLALLLFVLVWLAGLGAVIMLWRRESGPYFSPRTP